MRPGTDEQDRAPPPPPSTVEVPIRNRGRSIRWSTVARSSTSPAPLALLSLALAFGLGCNCARVGSLAADAAVPASAAPANQAQPVATSRVVEHGQVIDLREGRVLYRLQPTQSIFEANDATRAYLVGRDDVLRAYDLASGAEVWHAAVVEHDDGSLEGLLVVEPDVKLLDLDGNVRWTAGPLAHDDMNAAVVTSGARVYVVIYSPIATGSTLYALDRATGKVLWKGTWTGSLSRSIYRTDVSLSLVEDRLVLRTDESAVRGVQVFSLPDGKRIFSNMRYRE